MRISSLILIALLSLTALPASAGSVDKTVDFELDTWYELNSTDGPVTLHRMRIERQKGHIKSKFFRPGNSEYLETVQIQIEYTNTSDDDYDARLGIRWLDENGDVIDGYNDKEGIDEDERKEEITVTLSTLKYGLERAKTLEIEIEY